MRNLAWALMLFSSTSLAALDAKYFDQIDHIAFAGNANGRGSMNFYGKRNVKAVIPKNSKAKVIKGSATKLPSGAWALKVRVEELGSTRNLGARAANTTSEYWVRYTEGSSYMTLVDNRNRVTAQAEDATRARINRDTPAADLNPVAISGSSKVAALPSYVTQPRTRSNPQAADSRSTDPVAEATQTIQRILNPRAAGGFCFACQTSSSRAFSAIEDLEGGIQQSISIEEIDAMIAGYSASPQVQNLMHIADRERRRSGGDQCYSDVKDDLTAARLINQSPIDHLGLANSAFLAETALEGQGFVDLLDSESYRSKYGTDPRKAPCGAVLVYRGGPRGHGHSETVVCTGNTRRYISDFRATQPITTKVGEDVENIERYTGYSRRAYSRRRAELSGERELTGIMIKDLRNTLPPSLARR